MRPQPPPRRADPVLALLLTNALAGAVVALIMVFSILLLDIGRLQTLISASEQPLVPTLLLAAGFIITFASVAMGSAIMRLGAPDELPPRGRQELVPIPIKARRFRR